MKWLLLPSSDRGPVGITESPYPVTYFFLFVVFIVLPALAAASRRALTQGITIPKIPLYSQLLGTQTILLVLALGTDAAADLGVRELLRLPSPPAWGWAALLLVVAIGAMMLSWRHTELSDRDVMRMITPTNGEERGLWVLVCIAAGLGEEIAWRGVLPLILAQWFHETWMIVALSALSFGLAHLMQGWKSAVVITMFGAAFHLVVIAGGSLWPAILAHALYDLAAGLWMSRRPAA